MAPQHKKILKQQFFFKRTINPDNVLINPNKRQAPK